MRFGFRKISSVAVDVGHSYCAVSDEDSTFSPHLLSCDHKTYGFIYSFFVHLKYVAGNLHVILVRKFETIFRLLIHFIAWT
jgi:hypothetical protein